MAHDALKQDTRYLDPWHLKQGERGFLGVCVMKLTPSAEQSSASTAAVIHRICIIPESRDLFPVTSLISSQNGYK